MSEREQYACTVVVDGTWRETADGEIDEEQRRVFDDAGRVVRIEKDESSTTAGMGTDGYFEKYTDYFYNTEGQVIRIEDWYVGKLEPFEVSTYVYGAEGRIARAQSDFDADGTAQSDTVYRYGDAGPLEKIEIVRGVETRTQISYDEDGLRNRKRVYVDGGLLVSFEYTYDFEQRMTSSLRDDLGEQPFKRLEHYEYHPDGELATTRVDMGADGSIDSVTERSYDDGGRILLQETDCDLDGVVDWRDSYEYDAFGRLVRKSIQMEDHDGVITIETTYDFSCHGP